MKNIPKHLLTLIFTQRTQYWLPKSQSLRSMILITKGMMNNLITVDKAKLQTSLS